MESGSPCWQKRNVMVGVLHTVSQLEKNIGYRFYHIPARLLACRPDEVEVVALYQSKKLFGEASSGIRFYGRVEGYKLLRRAEIPEIPARRASNEWYCKFQIVEWESLPRTIRAVGLAPGVSMLTTEFLLKHAWHFPELYIRTEEQWELYSLLCKAARRTSRSGGSERLPACGENTVLVSGQKIGVYTKDGRYEQYDLRESFYEPYGFLQKMLTIVK